METIVLFDSHQEMSEDIGRGGWRGRGGREGCSERAHANSFFTPPDPATGEPHPNPTLAPPQPHPHPIIARQHKTRDVRSGKTRRLLWQAKTSAVARRMGTTKGTHAEKGRLLDVLPQQRSCLTTASSSNITHRHAPSQVCMLHPLSSSWFTIIYHHSAPFSVHRSSDIIIAQHSAPFRTH